MKRRATIYCLCDKAGDFCKECPQGKRIRPNVILHNPNWKWGSKINK